MTITVATDRAVISSRVGSLPAVSPAMDQSEGATHYWATTPEELVLSRRRAKQPFATEARFPFVSPIEDPWTTTKPRIYLT